MTDTNQRQQTVLLTHFPPYVTVSMTAGLCACVARLLLLVNESLMLDPTDAQCLLNSTRQGMSGGG